MTKNSIIWLFGTSRNKYPDLGVRRRRDRTPKSGTVSRQVWRTHYFAMRLKFLALSGESGDPQNMLYFVHAIAR
jgi:hypothetical protein